MQKQGKGKRDDRLNDFLLATTFLLDTSDQRSFPELCIFFWGVGAWVIFRLIWLELQSVTLIQRSKSLICLLHERIRDWSLCWRYSYRQKWLSHNSSCKFFFFKSWCSVKLSTNERDIFNSIFRYSQLINVRSALSCS